MAVTLNASTSAGLVQTADTSGNLSLQSNGTTILALTSAGAAVDGTLSATGTTTLGASTERVQINRLSDATAYGLITLNGLDASTTACGIYGRGSGGDSGKLFITGIGTVVSQIAGVTVTSVSSTGLAITGTLSASGATTLSSTLGVTTSVDITGSNGARSLLIKTGGIVSLYDSGNTEQARIQANTNGLILGTVTAKPITLNYNSSTAMQISGVNSFQFANAGVSASCMFSGYTGNSTQFDWGPGTGSEGLFRVQNGGSTGVYLSNGNTSWTANSDERLKNISGEFTGALEFITTKVRTVRGTWKADETKRSRSFLIAQDWQEYLPEGIEVSGDGILGLTKEDTIPVAFSAIKELAAMVKDLTTRLAALEAK